MLGNNLLPLGKLLAQTGVAEKHAEDSPVPRFILGHFQKYGASHSNNLQKVKFYMVQNRQVT